MAVDLRPGGCSQLAHIATQLVLAKSLRETTRTAARSPTEKRHPSWAGLALPVRRQAPRRRPHNYSLWAKFAKPDFTEKGKGGDFNRLRWRLQSQCAGQKRFVSRRSSLQMPEICASSPPKQHHCTREPNVPTKDPHREKTLFEASMTK